MKKILAAAAVIGLAAGAAFAQMEGMKHDGMGSGQSSEMKKGEHMMSPEMMKDMSGMMNHMIEMMKQMSHSMGHRTVTEHMKMNDMAKVMKEMSGVMNEMADQMAKGKVDPAVMKKMQERIKMMTQVMEKTE